MTKIMEKWLNFGSVIHGKITEFWNRDCFDYIHVQINMYFTFTIFTDSLFTKYSSETLVILVFKANDTPWQIGLGQLNLTLGK